MTSFTPVQSQSYLLYGNGAIIGDTTLILASFKDIDGNNLSMSDFGTTGTGTIEPNAGSSEEQILFTGVTQNSNGTATLTGVKSVAFKTPYTQTSGLVKSHAGNTTFVLSDTAYLFSQYASLPGTQTFTGTDTFTVAPIIPTVSSSQTNQAASVGYVNATAIAGAPKASNTVFGITELSVAAVTASVPIAVGDNDPRMSYVTASESLALLGNSGTPSSLNTYVTQLGYQIGTESFAVTSGSSTALAITLSPTPAGYVKGERIYFQTNVASGTSPTINKNTLGAKSIYKWTNSGTTPLAIGDMGTNQLNVAEYDGAAYQLLSPIANGFVIPAGKNGTTTRDMTAASGNQTIAHGLGVIPRVVKFTSIVSASPANYSFGVYNGTTSTVYFGTAAAITAGVDSTNVIYMQIGNGATQVATLTVDATNLTLAWTKVGSPSGTAEIMWEAYA